MPIEMAPCREKKNKNYWHNCCISISPMKKFRNNCSFINRVIHEVPQPGVFWTPVSLNTIGLKWEVRGSNEFSHLNRRPKPSVGFIQNVPHKMLIVEDKECVKTVQGAALTPGPCSIGGAFCNLAPPWIPGSQGLAHILSIAMWNS